MFLDHHLGLHKVDPLTFEWIREFNWGNLSFVRGVRYAVHPENCIELRGRAISMLSMISDSSVSVVEPAEMSESVNTLPCS